MPRPGPVYDDAMKILADDDLDALLSVVGVHDHAEPESVELPGSTTKADLVARTPTGLVHVEFMKDPAPDMDLRMVEYRLRLRRRDRWGPLAQFVLVLRELAVPDRYVDPGTDELLGTWTVVRLDRLRADPLLATPTTAAIAALAAGSEADRAAALTAAVELITAATDPDRRRRLLRAATTLASIVLPGPIIDAALKEADMPVPIRDLPLARELLEEGRQEGLQEGRQEGERAAALRMAQRMLRRRFGADERIDDVAGKLAQLPEDVWFARIDAAQSLDDLDE